MSFSATERYREKALRLGTKESAWWWTRLHSDYQEDIAALCDHIDEQREAIEGFISLLTEYYWEADDPELAAVNRLRRLIGWRDQLPQAQEVELQCDEAEGQPYE